MGFDASVISGVVKFIEPEFGLTKIELGWAVASLALTATIAMMFAGPLSDRFGRKRVLLVAAMLFLVSALASALANSFLALVIARMVGGFGVGAALIVAPMYIAELAPADQRGKLVSFNQLNIVIGISVAFFSNFLILKLGQSDAPWAEQLRFADWNWRWMLGLEALPALLYWFCLRYVPESPRWLLNQGREEQAVAVMTDLVGESLARAQAEEIKQALESATSESQTTALKKTRQLLKPSMRLVMIIGISIAILQQITGINAVFFYAPMIFEQSGIGTDASFMQAVLVGLVNLVFTVIALMVIDRLGRKPLLCGGFLGIAVSMFILTFGFNSASYQLTGDSLDSLNLNIESQQLEGILDTTFASDIEFKSAVQNLLGEEQTAVVEADLVTAAIDINASLILLGILGFVASFAVSVGPVMWVLFSELFPNSLRGVAISFVGLINSSVSFLVQLVFPWELATLGSSMTFMIYGLFALVGLVISLTILPETKGKSLEELESLLIKA